MQDTTVCERYVLKNSFAYWGTDLTPYTTPLECGREYRVKYEASYS